MLAAGCGTIEPEAGAGSGPQLTGPAKTPAPDNTGPHPVYIINDPVDPPVSLAGITPGLIVNLQAPSPSSGDDSGLTDFYEVPAATGQPVRNTGPHPVIAINLPAETPPPTGSSGTPAHNGPRTVVVVMGDANMITHHGGRRTIVVHISLPLQYNDAHPPTPSPAATTTGASTTARHRSSAR